jgi:ferredoxin
VEIDRTLCIGYGLCARTAPGSLRLDADGIAETIPDAAHGEAVVEAAATCPMEAIALYEDDGRAAA